jgi:hypothetical protein
MINTLKPVFFIATILFFIASCSFDKSDELKPEPPVINDTVQIRFSKDIVPILQTYCYGDGEQRCHVTNTNQYAAFDFSTCWILSDVAKDGLLDDRVFSPEADMPPLNSFSPQQLSDTALQILNLWVEQGAKCN